MVETVENLVCQYREKALMRQEDLAEAVGVTRQTIIAIEKGHYIPSVLLAIKISKVFKTPLEKIFSIAYEKKHRT